MTEKNTTSLGRRILLKRKESGLTQRELASKVGVSMAAVSLWEKDSSEPGARKLEDLAKALNCSTLWLLTGDESTTTDRSTGFLYQPQGDIQKLETILDLLPESVRKDILDYAKTRLSEHLQMMENLWKQIENNGNSKS